LLKNPYLILYKLISGKSCLSHRSKLNFAHFLIDKCQIVVVGLEEGDSVMLPKMLNSKQIIKIWEQIHAENRIPEDIIISKEVRDSWGRSQQYRVDQLMIRNEYVLSRTELNKKIESNRKLLELVIPQMNVLYSLTKDAGFCITLCDNQGYLLKRIGEKPEMDFTAYSNFIEGSNWSEKVMGTNAVGLVLIEDKPIQTYGYEHYCKCAWLSNAIKPSAIDCMIAHLNILDISTSLNRFFDTKAFSIAETEDTTMPKV
jgi:hypothetical protein